jgi:hypothetical protein
VTSHDYLDEVVELNAAGQQEHYLHHIPRTINPHVLDVALPCGRRNPIIPVTLQVLEVLFRDCVRQRCVPSLRKVQRSQLLGRGRLLPQGCSRIGSWYRGARTLDRQQSGPQQPSC